MDRFGKCAFNYLVLWLFCAFCYPAFAQSGKYPIKNFTPDDYKAGIQNIGFAQNRDMTLFVANNLGVISLNGNDWQIHASRTGKKQRSLAFDESTDRLYVGSQGDFGYFEKDWHYVSLIEKIPIAARDFDEVWDVFMLKSNVFFCTFQRIYVFNGSTISVVESKKGFNKSFGLANHVFTQDAEGQLFEVKELRLTSSFPQNQKGQIIAGVIAKDDGYLVFYNSGKIEFTTALAAANEYPMLVRVLEGNYVNHVTQLSDSRLVISTQRAGLYLFDMQTKMIENITTENGLQSSACLRTFQDHGGNLWVGMQNGLALVDINSSMRLINQEIKLQGSGYEAYDTDEGIYYTTSNGIYFLAKGASQCTFLKGTEGPAYGMQLILNKLYAGHHTGLFILQRGVAKRCATTEGLWQVKQLRSQPKYAIGGTYAGLFLFKLNQQNELEEVQKIRGFEESSRFFEEDNKGRIWVGQFYKGLFQLTFTKEMLEATVTKISDSSDLPLKKHIILSKIDDVIYIGTEEGIYQLDETTDRISEANFFSEALGKPWIYLLAQEKKRKIHIVTEHGVGFIKQVGPANLTYVPSSLFQLRHSFNNDLLHVSVNVQKGIMINASEGFIQYDPELEERETTAIVPIVSRVYGVAEDSILFARQPFENRAERIDKLVISEGLKVLQFSVETFEFKDVGNKRYRYFLKGFDKDYGQWTNATEKEYTNLREGNYDFFVQTVNSFGENVTSKPLQVKVHPPFYRSGWMKVVYFALTMLAFFLAYRFQNEYHKKKARLLDIARQRELIQKQNELKLLKEEQIQSELEHVNNLLAASTMNLVVKNEFMENIKMELKEVSLREEPTERRNALEKIIKEIDTALRLQEDWKHFEHHFDRVHGDFLTRLTTEFTDLTPGEQKLCAFLRLKMDTKEIANLMAISLRGVEVARYRLRKKFGLGTSQNLSKFILEY
jgi:DNA-binding CsgD family transcriptional regulator